MAALPGKVPRGTTTCGGIDEPAALVAALEARARRVETPCGNDTMAWRIWGAEHVERPPVVLGHGAQGAWSHWIGNIEALAQRFMVIAADLPGHGDSALPATPDHAGISAALAEGIRQIVGDGRAVDLVGFSFGGVAFAHCAALHPGIARRVILIGCGGLDTPLGNIDLRRVRGLRGEAREAALKANLLGLMLHHPESADGLAMHLLVANARKARLDVPGLVLPDRLVTVLPKVAVPVDALWGEFDRPHPEPALQEAVIRGIQPGADFRVIASAGHWAMYERPDAFNPALIDMLESSPRALL
ncbi:MAG: alpha/beta hydrolase [Novosphingobium sp.]